MNYFKCDMCGKETTLLPRTERIIEKNDDGQDIPIFTETSYQDPNDGKIKMRKIPAYRDLDSRTYIVSLSIGSDRVQRDFCIDCLNKIKDKLIDTFTLLSSVQSK